jgi:hypothetical protein
MKKIIGFAATMVFVWSLSAQSINRGDWLGKTPSGHPYKMIVQGGQEGEPSSILIIDDDIDSMMKGQLKGDSLSFRSSYGTTVLKRVPYRKPYEGQQSLIIFLPRSGAKVAYKHVSGPVVLSGWDEGVAAVFRERIAAGK